MRKSLLRWLAALSLCGGCAGEEPAGRGGREPGPTNQEQFQNADPNPGEFGNSGDMLGNPGGGTVNPDTGGCVTGEGDQGDFEFSYIWVANAAESTISKINTRSMEEEARYLTREDAAGNPSRTTVNFSGDVAVANRAGGVAKFYAQVEDCQDQNGDGVVTTSGGKDDVLAWDMEECRAWYTPFSYASQRPLAWAPGALNTATCTYEGEKLWTSGTSYGCVDADCQIDVLRLNGETGVVEDTILVAGLSGANFISGGLGGLDFGLGGIGITGYGGYGGASDGDGNFWVFVSNTTQLVRIDNASLAIETWKIPSDNGYGITVDAKGRVFVCGQAGITRFDYTTQEFRETSVLNVGYNGCMTDGAGTLWVGGGGDDGSPGVHAINTDTLDLVNSIAVASGAKGVSIDFDGMVWAVAKGDTAAKVDPVSGMITSYEGLNGAYSYSDMTGFGLRSAGTATPPD